MLLTFRPRISVRVPPLLIPRNLPRVVLENIIQMLPVRRILLPGIRIPTHRPERQRSHGEPVRRIEIHILLVPIHQEEIISRPLRRQGRQPRRIELQRDLISGPEHYEPIIERSQQRQHVAITRVLPRLPRKRT